MWLLSPQPVHECGDAGACGEAAIGADECAPFVEVGKGGGGS